MINIKATGAGYIIVVDMENDHLDAVHYTRKAEEYRAKARATLDLRIRSGLEAVAREYIRKARELDGEVLRLASIK